MLTTAPMSPPGYAWDWFARQRLVWMDAARRLDATRDPEQGQPRAFPDWSALVSDGDSPTADPALPDPGRDWSTLRTRGDVVAALRKDYPLDADVRAATDAAVRTMAFLDRLGSPLESRGVRTVPRGMRWWWDHLGGAAVEPSPRSAGSPSMRAAATPSARTVPLQLAFADVMAGYGDSRTETSHVGTMKGDRP
jgi:hypothetical protein